MNREHLKARMMDYLGNGGATWVPSQPEFWLIAQNTPDEDEVFGWLLGQLAEKTLDRMSMVGVREAMCSEEHERD